MHKGSIVNKQWSAEQVKTLLLTMKVTQAEFARIMGVAKLTVNRWVRGVVAPKMKHLRELERLQEQWGIPRTPFKGGSNETNLSSNP